MQSKSHKHVQGNHSVSSVILGLSLFRPFLKIKVPIKGWTALFSFGFCKFLETVAVMQTLSVDVQNVGVFNNILSSVQFLFSFALSSLSCTRIKRIRISAKDRIKKYKWSPARLTKRDAIFKLSGHPYNLYYTCSHLPLLRLTAT